jgi:hypothetical protein
MEGCCCWSFAAVTFGAGLMAVIRGRVQLSSRSTVEGAAARWIGTLLMGTIPLAGMLALVGVSIKPDPLVSIVVSAAVVAAGIVAAVIIAVMTAKPKNVEPKEE